MILKSSKGTKVHIILAGMTNCYLIQKDGINILVDSGVEKSYRKLNKQIKIILGSDPMIHYHLLTHTHYDHAGNSNRIKKDFNAQLVVHANEAEWVKKGFTRLPKGTSWLFKLISNSGNRFASSIGKYQPALPDVIIDGFQLLDENKNLKIIHTPGHTIGSVSLIIDNELAIVGDTLFGIFKSKIFPPFADDVETLYKTWELLLSTKCRLFLPGHGKPVKLEKFKKYYSQTIHKKIKIH
ncbi:MAG: MBL fold metallo-hydrolase [Thiohalospira sp.]